MSGGKKQKWYFDACVLDKNKDSIADIVNNAKHRQNCVSHLALGEAYGCCLSKGKGNEKAEAFVQLINSIKKYISVIGNNISKKILDDVKLKFPKLKLADAIHLATAIDAKCDMLCTSDYDIYQYDKKDINELSNGCNGTVLNILKVK